MALDLQQPTFEDLELLAEVSQLLKVIDLDEVLQKVIQLVSKSVGAEKTSLFLQESQQVDWDHLITMRNLSGDEAFAVVSKVLDDGFAGWVVRQREGDFITDTLEDGRWIIFPDDPVPVRSVLCVPFIADDEVIAVVTLTHSEPQHFTDYHLRLLTIIANQASTAIHNAQLFHRVNAQQRQLQTILQAMQDIVIVVNEQGQLMLVNEVAQQFLDLEQRSDVLNRYLDEFVKVDSVLQPIADVIENESENEEEVWTFRVRSERRQKDYQVRMAVWHDVRQGVDGYVIVMHDVTTIQDLSRFKDEMLRVASHDLRSPLALITGYADMVAMDTPEDNEYVHQYVDIIKSTTDKMGNLLDDLLRIERVRNSPMELHELIDPQQLIKLVIVNSKHSAQAKNQTIESELHLQDVPPILADPVLIRQALENLINNAIKYSAVGGRIRIQATYDEHKVYVSVQDNGIGIPQEHLGHIFETFYRVEQEGNTEQGSGLGLSLVRNVIERHGGEIRVNSLVGEGSEFYFWLPLADKTETETTN